MSNKKIWLLVAIVVPLALLASLIVWAQTTKHYDGHCESDDLDYIDCYNGFAGLDVARSVGANEVFTAALTTVDVTLAANGYVCPSAVTFFLKSGGSDVDTWVFTTTGGTTLEFNHEFSVDIGSSYWFEIWASGSGCGWIEWVDVYGVGEEEPPEPTPETGCINDNPELETSTGWTDINTPTWLTETVLLDQLDGFSQTVALQPGAYTIHITATIDPENLDYKPLTVSLGLTETQQVVEMWGVHYVNFAVSEEGTYTLTIESGYDGEVELGWACLMAVSCINEDEYLMNDQRWDSILEPEFLSYSGGAGVLMEYREGVLQQVTLDAGGYQLEVSATLPISFPVESSSLQMCLNDACALSTVTTETIKATFNVLSSGAYNLTITNLSSSYMFTGSQVVTVTYACLSLLSNPCLVVDPAMDNVHIPMLQSGEQGWLTTYSGVPQPGGALLGCDETVEQWVYLPSGAYTMTVLAQSNVYMYPVGGIPTPMSGTLTVQISSESDPLNFTNYLLDVAHVEDDDFTNQDFSLPYTVTFEVDTGQNYLISFANKDNCKRGLNPQRGDLWVDYVCLDEQTAWDEATRPRVGQCSSLIDAPFQEYEAQHWDKSGDVTWSAGQVSLAQGATISQTVRISNTAEMTNTTWVLYVVAKSNYTSTLRGGLGAESYDWTIGDGNDFVIYTATLTSTMPVSVSVSAITTSDRIDLDFVCVYDPSEVPEGPWDNGIDDDTECVQPEVPPGGLSLGETVQRWLSWIGDWIKYLVCLLVHWLQKIWLAIVNWAKSFVVNIGLDDFWKSFMAWLMKLLQGPYDTALLVAFIFSLVFLVAYRVFGLLRVIAGVITLFASALFFALRFVLSLIGAAISAIAAPCEALTISVPVPIIYGVLISLAAIEEIPMITYVEWMLIGLMALQLVIWTIGAFSLGGGSE